MTIRYAALAAAAGMSSCMQAFKPLLPFAGKSIIEYVVGNYQAQSIQPVVVVTGYRHDLLQPVVEQCGAHSIHNADYASTGMLESLALGLNYLKDRCDAVFIQPGDIPLIAPTTFSALQRGLAEHDVMAARPVHQGRRGHPVLLSAAAFSSILGYAGGDGLRGALRELPGGAVDIEVDDPGILLDADSPDQYQALLARLAGRETAGPYE